MRERGGLKIDFGWIRGFKRPWRTRIGIIGSSKLLLYVVSVELSLEKCYGKLGIVIGSLQLYGVRGRRKVVADTSWIKNVGVESLRKVGPYKGRGEVSHCLLSYYNMLQNICSLTFLQIQNTQKYFPIFHNGAQTIYIFMTEWLIL